MVAQYDWKGQRNDDLSFKKGDLISVVERCEDHGWLIGEVIRDDEEGSSVRGMFPESYCELVLEDRRKSPSNVNCFRNKYVALTRKIETERKEMARASDTAREKHDIENLMDERQKLGLSIKTCQQAHTNKH